MKYWPTPKQRSWFSVYLDGNCIGIFQEGAAADREKKRLSGLKGICVTFALPNDLIKFHAATKLSSRILRVMSEKSVCFRWKPRSLSELECCRWLQFQAGTFGLTPLTINPVQLAI